MRISLGVITLAKAPEQVTERVLAEPEIHKQPSTPEPADIPPAMPRRGRPPGKPSHLPEQQTIDAQPAHESEVLEPREDR